MSAQDLHEVQEEFGRRFEAVRRRAFEEHVAKLIRDGAPIEDEQERAIHGRKPTTSFRGVEIAGSYPKTEIKIRIYEEARAVEKEYRYPVWWEYFQDPLGKMRDPEFIASEMLVWARGG